MGAGGGLTSLTVDGCEEGKKGSVVGLIKQQFTIPNSWNVPG